ncbi:MAG: hypothetical protein ABII13_01620 [Patescibacteria group bacterium]|nr:hypothetical protein [Patescibacteria group bacterium]
MKKIILSLLCLTAVTGITSFLISSGQAETYIPESGPYTFEERFPSYHHLINNLVKGPGPTVYWVAENGVRYPFPNIQTFWSWFPSSKLAEVKSVTISQMAEIPLGGNVTYRPGAKLVKTPSSPKVYAVSRFGVLNWVKTENLAKQLYGSEWQKWLQDIPEKLFEDYTIGQPIEHVWDYNVGNQYTTVNNPTINIIENLDSGSLSLTLSKYHIVKGETSKLTATLDSNNQVSIARIELLDIHGDTPVTLKTCENTTSCSISVTVDGKEATRSYLAVVKYDSPYQSNKRIYSNATTLRTSVPNSNFRGSVIIDSEIVAPQNMTPIIRVVATVLNPSVLDKDVVVRIFDGKYNNLIATCEGSVTCVAEDYVLDIDAATKVKYYAVVSDSKNQALEPVWTEIEALPQGWYSSFDKWTFTANEYGIITDMTYELEKQSNNFGLVKTSLWDLKRGIQIPSNDPNYAVAPNSTVLLDAQVEAPKFTDRLYVELTDLNGRVYKTCQGTGSVNCSAYIWFGEDAAYKNFFFVVRANNQINEKKDFYLKDFVYVSGNNGFGGNVRVLADSKELVSGDSLNISTKIMAQTYPIANLTTKIYNLETETLIKACKWTTECQTKTVIDVGLESLNYYAIVSDDGGREMHAEFSRTVDLRTE